MQIPSVHARLRSQELSHTVQTMLSVCIPTKRREATLQFLNIVCTYSTCT